MRLESYSKLLGVLAGISILATVGCAIQGATPSQEAPAATQAAVPADTSSPASPVTVTAETVVPVEVKKEPEAPPKPGTFASVLKKLFDNPFTLYWRDKDSYSYHIGDVVDAEYKPGEGMVVKSQEPDNAVVCEFNNEGKLINVNAKQGGQDLCSELMFTLDEELDLGE